MSVDREDVRINIPGPRYVHSYHSVHVRMVLKESSRYSVVVSLDWRYDDGVPMTMRPALSEVLAGSDIQSSKVEAPYVTCTGGVMVETVALEQRLPLVVVVGNDTACIDLPSIDAA